MKKKYEILPLISDDIDEAVLHHIKAFPDFFLTSLGQGFLKILYSRYVTDLFSISLCARDHESHEIIGVVIGTLNCKNFYSGMLRTYWKSLLIESIKNSFLRPRIFFRLFRGLWYRGGESSGLGGALLASISVDPEKRRMGLGSSLVKKFLTIAQKGNAKFVEITTDSKGNSGGNDFYSDLGFKLESTFQTPDGREMNLYRYYF